MTTTSQSGGGEVHLYCIPLPHHPAELSHFENILSPLERDRAGLLKIDHVKKRFIAGRGVLREILGGYLGIAPETVTIAAREHGKPYLPECPENICFNLSHTGEVLLIAVSTNIEVGIDIEMIDFDKPFHVMARLALSPREQEELFKISSLQLRTEAFYRCWVRKEACLKASGHGFSLPGNSFDVPMTAEDPLMMTISCDQKKWHVMDIQLPHPYCAALAVEARGSSQSPPKVIWVVPETGTLIHNWPITP